MAAPPLPIHLWCIPCDAGSSAPVLPSPPAVAAVPASPPVEIAISSGGGSCGTPLSRIRSDMLPAGSRSGLSCYWAEIPLSDESVCTICDSTDPSSSKSTSSLEACSAASPSANSCSAMSARRYCSPSGRGEFARWADGAAGRWRGLRVRGIFYGDVCPVRWAAECMAIAGVSPKIDAIA